MARRIAVLIGTSRSPEARDDLPDLEGPPNDLELLEAVLGDPEYGEFQIRPFLNAESGPVREALEELFTEEADTDDLVLLYYSGHGTFDARGRLCLAMRNTRRRAMRATSIPVATLRDYLASSRCGRVVVILDCCFSGAAGKEFGSLRSQVGDQVHALQQGAGRFVLASSASTDVSRETRRDDDGRVFGRFTQALAGGLTRGEADVDNDGWVTVPDLTSYLQRALPDQPPHHWALEVSGPPILLSKNPAPKPAELPKELQAAIQSVLSELRLGAVSVLARVLRTGEPSHALAARLALEDLRRDDSRSVSAAADQVLATVPGPAAPSGVRSTGQPPGLPGAEIPIASESWEARPAGAPTTETVHRAVHVSDATAAPAAIEEMPPEIAHTPTHTESRITWTEVFLPLGWGLIAVLAIGVGYLVWNGPPTARLSVRPDPPEARVWLNDTALGAADRDDYELAAGEQVCVRAEYEGYAPYRECLVLKPSENRVLQLPLEPTGSAPDPLFANGDSARDELKPSENPIARRRVGSSDSPPDPLVFPLPADLLPGRLMVRSNVSGDRVLLDGRDVGPSGPTVHEVDTGRPIRVRVEKDGYASEERMVELDPDGEATERFVLDQLPGRLIVQSNVAGARVLLDGRDVGMAGPTVHEVESGRPIRVRVEKVGYGSAETVVKLAAGVERSVQVDLERVFEAGRVIRDCEVCPELVVVPSGEFEMGSPDSEPERDSTEDPRHRVRIPAPFAIGRYEVTFEEWDACVSAGGCMHQPSDMVWWGRGRRPVINVSWKDTKEYVTWLSRKTGHGYRLPTESEWEYAARAGTTTPFWFGAQITTDQANYRGGNLPYVGRTEGVYREKALPIGSFAANAFGLYDVHGNVSEWVADCFHTDYEGAPTDGSEWTSGHCFGRVLRGGSWDDLARDLRSASRKWTGAGGSSDNIGFRVARTLP